MHMRLELNSDRSSRAVENEKKIELKYTTMVEGARTVHTDTLRKKSNNFFPANLQHTQIDFVSVLNAISTNMNGLYAQLSMVLYTMVQSVFVWFFSAVIIYAHTQFSAVVIVSTCANIISPTFFPIQVHQIRTKWLLF